MKGAQRVERFDDQGRFCRNAAEVQLGYRRRALQVGLVEASLTGHELIVAVVAGEAVVHPKQRLCPVRLLRIDGERFADLVPVSFAGIELFARLGIDVRAPVGRGQLSLVNQLGIGRAGLRHVEGDAIIAPMRGH